MVAHPTIYEKPSSVGVLQADPVVVHLWLKKYPNCLCMKQRLSAAASLDAGSMASFWYTAERQTPFRMEPVLPQGKSRVYALPSGVFLQRTNTFFRQHQTSKS